MAHLKTQQTRGDPAERARWKLRLSRWLFGRGWDRGAILELYRFIDWVMALPPALELQHRSTLVREQEGQSMPHLTYWERQGIAKGIEQGIEQGIEKGLEQGIEKGKREGRLEGLREHARRAVLQALEVRFGAVPEHVAAAVGALEDLQRLDGLLREAIVAASVREFERQLDVDR
jgi:hypothetical protein